MNWLQSASGNSGAAPPGGRAARARAGAPRAARGIGDGRSGCPINQAIEVIGDRWSLLVIRDMMFGNRHHFGELLAGSEEGIASNILADRLRRLTEHGLVSRAPDPSHKQKVIYNLTEAAIELVPVIAQLGAWGRRHLPTTPELAIRAQLLEEGGPQLWEEFMDELREQHLGIPRPAGAEPVLARLQAAYEAEVAAGGSARPEGRAASRRGRGR